MLRYIIFSLVLLQFGCNTQKSIDAEGRLNIHHFGAVGDGKTLNTTFIQAAIDSAFANGGGEVLVPPGNYLSTTIFLKDNVTLNISADATILASPNIDEYPQLAWHGAIKSNTSALLITSS